MEKILKLCKDSDLVLLTNEDKKNIDFSYNDYELVEVCCKNENLFKQLYSLIKLVEIPIKPEYQDEFKSENILCHCCRYNKYTIVKLILDIDPEYYISTKNNEALKLVCQEGYIEIFHLLINKVEYDENIIKKAVENSKVNSLVINNKIKIVEYLLDNCVNINNSISILLRYGLSSIISRLKLDKYDIDYSKIIDNIFEYISRLCSSPSPRTIVVKLFENEKLNKYLYGIKDYDLYNNTINFDIDQLLFDMFPNLFSVSYTYELLHQCTYKNRLDFMKKVYNEKKTEIKFLEKKYNYYHKSNDLYTAYMAFELASKNGHLEIGKWLYSIIPDIDLLYGNQQYLYDAFRYSSVYNNIKYIEYIEWLISLEKFDIRSEYLELACFNCFNEGIDLILKINPTLDIYNNNYGVFNISSNNPMIENMDIHIETLIKLLKIHDNNSKKDEHINIYNEIFHFYSIDSKLNSVSEWIYTKYYDKIDIYYDNNRLLKSLIKFNDIDKLTWLLEKKPDIDLLSNTEIYDYFYNIEGIKWYMDNCNDFDISYNNEQLFRNDNIISNISIIKWLIEIKPDIDIEACNHYTFKNSCKYYYLDVAEYLVSLRPDKYFIYPDENDDPDIDELNFKIINTLTFEKEIKDFDTQEICCICYNKECNIVTNCNHKYCSDCLTKWINTILIFSCPYCKNDNIKLYKINIIK